MEALDLGMIYPLRVKITMIVQLALQTNFETVDITKL